MGSVVRYCEPQSVCCISQKLERTSFHVITLRPKCYSRVRRSSHPLGRRTYQDAGNGCINQRMPLNTPITHQIPSNFFGASLKTRQTSCLTICTLNRLAASYWRLSSQSYLTDDCNRLNDRLADDTCLLYKDQMLLRLSICAESTPTDVSSFDLFSV